MTQHVMQEIASFSAVFIAILQFIFVILFGLFFKRVTELKEEIEAIMAFLVCSEHNFRSTLDLATRNNSILRQNQRRQNTIARLIMRSQTTINEHHKASKDFIDALQAQIDSGELRIVKLSQAASESPQQAGP